MTLRPFCALVLSLLVGSAFAGTDRPVKDGRNDFDVSMFLQNFGGPFVDREFAEKLARLVVEQKYRRTFVAAPTLGVSETPDTWAITLENALIPAADHDWMPLVNGEPSSRRLTIQIRKKDGAILDIS